MLLKMLKVIPALLLGFTVTLSTPALAKPSVNKAQALQAHNTARIKDKQRPLQWSPDLENISQKWANQLASNCKVYHHQGDIPFGENLFISTAPTTVGHAVNAWVNEKNFYNHPQNKCQAGKQCGHYTQVVWKGTTDVGCAMQSCSNGSQIYVCSYFPGGNVVGARPF
jgi:pathogenesis-related protein 1